MLERLRRAFGAAVLPIETSDSMRGVGLAAYRMCDALTATQLTTLRCGSG
jgi:hypothetical protein